MNIKFKDYPLDFNLLLIEIVICFVFLILSSFFDNWMKILSLITFMGLWLKNYIVLDFVIDTRKYLITSIPFLVLSLIYLYILFSKIKQKPTS